MPGRLTSHLPAILASFLFLSTATAAQPEVAQIENEVPLVEHRDATGPLRVGLVERPPFSIQTASGAWTGIGVDLWRMIAEAHDYDYEWVRLEVDPETAVAGGDVDLALPVVATAEGEARLDYSLPFYTATLAAAGAGTFDFMSVVGAFLSWTFLRIVLVVSALLLAIGTLMWLIEREANAAQFGTEEEGLGRARRWLRGIGSGFWWSGVTMTTIGYGDKAPITALGRAVAMVWMLFAMGLTASLTASIVAATNLQGLSRLQLPEDLRDRHLGALSGTAAASYLEAEGLDFIPYDDVAAALRDVATKRIDAVIAPQPVLQHANDAAGTGLTVSPSRARPSHLTIALPSGSDLREPINAAILELTAGSGWTALVERYAPDT